MANRQYTVPIEIVPSSGGGGAGTVTSVATGGIATGGPITTSGTVTVAGSGNTTTAATAAANLAAAPANDVVTTDGSGNVKDSGTLLASLAPLASPTFTGTVTIPTAAITTVSGNPNFSGTPTFANPVALGSSTATTQAAATNNTTLATTAFVQAAVGASGAVVWNNLGNATGNLTLSNGSNTTEFDQTSNTTWVWANTTIATSGTTNASPLLGLRAQYWTGAASANDTWTIGSSLGSGTNGNAVLTLNHSGSTSATFLQVSRAGAAVYAINFLGLGQTQFANSAAGGAANFSSQITTQTTPSFAVANTGNFTRTAAGTQTAFLVGATNSNQGANFAPTSGTAAFLVCNVQSTINQTGGANGTVTDIMVNATETAVGGTHNFIDLQGGSGGATRKFTINNSGVVSNYNGIAAVRNGIPAEYASSDLTAQTAAITATTLYATTATSAYRVSWSAAITTAASTSSVLGGTNGFQVLYTSPTDSVVKTTVAGASVTSAANTTGTATSGVLTVYAKTGTNIQFTYDYTSVGVTQMAFEIHVTVEQL